MVSQLAPIRSFGVYGAMGTLLTLGVVLAFLPGTLAAWRPKSLGAAAHGGPERHPAWHWLSGTVMRYHLLIVLGSVLLTGAAAWGIQWLTTSVHIETLFGRDSRILRDYAWIEEHVGPLVPVEIVLDFGRDCRLSQADRLAMVERVEREAAPCRARLGHDELREFPADGAAGHRSHEP